MNVYNLPFLLINTYFVSGISLIEGYNKYSGTEMEFRYSTFIPKSILMGIKEISLILILNKDSCAGENTILSSISYLFSSSPLF